MAKKVAERDIFHLTSIKWFLRIISLTMSVEAFVILQTSKTLDIPISQSFINSTTSEIANVQAFSIRISSWVAFLLLVSATSYLVVSTTGFGWYYKGLQHKVNYMRWLHHSVSTSFMIIITAVLSGITSILSLALILIVSVAVNMAGLLMEVYNGRRRKIVWHAYYIGLGLITSGWLVMMITFASVHWSTNRAISSELVGLYAVISSLIVMYALTMFFHYKKIGPWKSYLYTERVYIVVNFLSKSAFAAIVYIGYLR